jgi:superfamily II DNA or RNA helicase
VPLHPYQQLFVAQLRSALREHRRIIACAATGSGKTHVQMHIAEQALERGRTVLLITEDRRIFDQAKAHRDFHEISAGVKNFYIRPKHAYLAMAQTLKRRQEMVDNFAFYKDQLLVIADEAHIGSATGILQQLPDAMLLGFTATPDWRIAKHLPELYRHCVVGPQPEELVQAGYLAPYRHFCRTSAKIKDLRLNSQGEYSEITQEQVFNGAKLYDELAADLRTFPFNKASVYTASIKHCEAAAAELRARGIHCVTFHSKLGAAGDDNLYLFRIGHVKVIVSVMGLTKGWDAPEVDMIVFYCKTASLAKYLQIIGRGSRTAPGKTGFTVIDHASNGLEHGAWDRERDWARMWYRKESSQGVAPVKLCPKCEYMMPASARVCLNCGYVFPVKDNDPGETQLVELTATYTQLRGKRLSQLTPAELAEYAREKNKPKYAARVAQAQEQLTPGFLEQYGRAMHYKPNWFHFQLSRIPAEKIEYHDFVLK